MIRPFRSLPASIPVVAALVVGCVAHGGGVAEGSRGGSTPQGAPSQPPTSAAVTPRTRDERWRADLHYLATELPRRHVNAYRYVTPAAFARAVAELDQVIPRLTDTQVQVRLLRLTALLQDGHTGLALGPAYHGRAPLELLWTDRGPYVVGADSARAGLLGRRIVGIGGRPIGAVADTLRLYLPHENEWGFRSAAAGALLVAAALHDVGVSDDTAALALDLEGSDGARSRATVPTVPADAPFTPVPPRGGEPLYRQRRGEKYWLALLPEQRTAFVKYNECRDSSDFAVIADSVARLVDAGRVTRVLVDLRDNGGGNSQVTRSLVAVVKARPAVNRPGGLYVVIGRRTFSSGLNAAHDFATETQAVLVGEPVGERPDNFGEVQSFRLPYSGLTVGYSTKEFRNPERQGNAYTPDVLIPPTPEAVVGGRDPVLDWVLAQR